MTDETFELTGQELEALFASAARYGAWLHYAQIQKQTLVKEASEVFGYDFDISSQEELEKRLRTTPREEKISGIISILSGFFTSKEDDPNTLGAGIEVFGVITALAQDKTLWDQIEVLDDILDQFLPEVIERSRTLRS